jgi:L-iditol 2-dehydrogenase
MSNTDPTIPIGRVQARELHIEGVFRYANTWRQAISMLANGLVDLDSLVTATFGLEDTEAGRRQPSGLSFIVFPSAPRLKENRRYSVVAAKTRGLRPEGNRIV